MIEPIDDLIARSSIGAGLANIRENGIEAELADLEAEAAPKAKAKRKKSTSPTQRTIAECKKRGWIAGVVERWNPHVRIRQDLFGVVDLIAIVPPELMHGYVDAEGNTLMRSGAILAIQCGVNTSGQHAAHRDKILAEPRAKAWVDAGGRLELWSWAKQGDRGKVKRWQLRVETYAEMVAGAGSEGA